MQKTPKHTPWRDRYICAKIRRVIHAIRPSGPVTLRHITDAQARDIGLEPSEIERLRFEYPSRVLRHPRL